MLGLGRARAAAAAAAAVGRRPVAGWAGSARRGLSGSGGGGGGGGGKRQRPSVSDQYFARVPKASEVPAATATAAAAEAGEGAGAVQSPLERAARSRAAVDNLPWAVRRNKFIATVTLLSMVTSIYVFCLYKMKQQNDLEELEDSMVIGVRGSGLSAKAPTGALSPGGTDSGGGGGSS